MATKNPKIQGYLKPAIYNAYDEFKRERGIESDSQALNQILSEFLGIDKDEPVRSVYEYQPDLIDRKIDAAINPLIRRIDEIEFIKLTLLTKLSDYLDSNLESNPSKLLNALDLSSSNLKESTGNLDDDSLSHLKESTSNLEIPLDGDLPSNLENELEKSTSNLESNLDSHLKEATSNLESNLEPSTNKIDNESQSNLKESTSNLENELESELESNLSEDKDAAKKKRGKKPAIDDPKLVREIRDFASTNSIEATVLKYKVSQSTVSKIKAKQTPYHLD